MTQSHGMYPDRRTGSGASAEPHLELSEVAREANQRLCVQLDSMFMGNNIYHPSPSEPIARLAHMTERLVSDLSSAWGPERTFPTDHLRINDGRTTFLTYGRGSRQSALVRAKDRGRGVFSLIFIAGQKDDPGVFAQHHLTEYELTSRDDLRSTLDIVQAGDLVRSLHDGSEIPPVTGVTGIKQLRSGSLTDSTLYFSGATDQEEASVSMQSGIQLADQSVDMLKTIGKHSRLINSVLGWLATVGPGSSRGVVQ